MVYRYLIHIIRSQTMKVRELACKRCWRMKIKNRYLRKLITLSTIIIMQLLIFVLPVQAANRNDFLFNLKDTFNSPISDKFSLNASIAIIISLVLLGLFFFYNTSEKNVRRTSRKLGRVKKSKQMLTSPQITSGMQRRNWFRLTTRAEFKWLPVDQTAQVRINRYKSDALHDISGGGMCFSTNEKLKSGDQIRILLYTGATEPLFLNGRVIRVNADNANDKISVEFVGIRDGQRDKIVAWILARQRLAIHGEKPEKYKLGNDD